MISVEFRADLLKRRFKQHETPPMPIEEFRSKFSITESGIVTRCYTTGTRSDLKGKEAGSLSKRGYWVVSISNKNYYRSHLVMYYFTGTWIPDGHYCDHINTIKTDDSFANLRFATPTQNSYNKPISQANRKIPYGNATRGISFRKENTKKPWVARFKRNGIKAAKAFETFEEAVSYREKMLEEEDAKRFLFKEVK